jgi:SAM-dependent methyltransferase
VDTQLLKQIAKHIPAPFYRLLNVRLHGQNYRPPVGMVDFGSFRRLSPISNCFGYDRGNPVDRYYIENFLAQQAHVIQGRVMEIGDASYTRRFGGDRVTASDILHVIEGNPEATIVGDLTTATHIPSEQFDCLILTQTLHLIYDLRAALQTIYRILKPGGVALVTSPGIAYISNAQWDQWADYWCWSFTTRSIRQLFEEVFPPAQVQVKAYGNVLTTIAFLEGLATHELCQEELDHHDPQYEMLITLQATKPNNNP